MSIPGEAVRIFQGQTVRGFVWSAVETDLIGHFRVLYDDGDEEDFVISRQATGSARTAVAWRTQRTAKKSGWVISAYVTILGTEPQRGQTYVIAWVSRATDPVGAAVDWVASDYVHAQHPITLGMNVPPGPAGGAGAGFRQNNRIANDIAPADITHVLGVTNALRRIDGFIWYYHCSGDVASRALRATVRDLGDGLPTGMTSGIRTSIIDYPSAGALTLTANEEGMIYVNANTGKSYAVSLDDSVRTTENITTAPDPFPYWAQEADVGEIFFNVANEEAADRQSIYIIEENWIKP